jgi:predicted transcriptional regulator of viral defense system
MNSSDRLKIMVESGKTVFRPIDLQILWQDKQLNAKINAIRMVERGIIIKLAKGYYALNENYNIYELANSIISPSYVSFDSALFYFSFNFQLKNQVSSVAPINYQKKIGQILFKYFSMKKKNLYNLEGIIIKNNVSIACPERAILDSFYFGFLPDVDNMENLNKKYLNRLSLFYPKTVQKKVKTFYGKD